MSVARVCCCLMAFASLPARPEIALVVPNVVANQVDGNVFPLLHDYLQQLPDGLRSYPQCQVISGFSVRLQRDLPDIWRDTRLPMALRSALREPWEEGSFLPQVLVTCQSLVMRDVLQTSESDYLRTANVVSWSVLSGPLYRAALHVMSPNLLLLNVSQRFSRFVRGTELVSLGGTKTSHRLRMITPPHLCPPVWHRFYVNTFVNVLRASRAQEAEAQIIHESDTQTLYDLKWR